MHKRTRARTYREFASYLERPEIVLKGALQRKVIFLIEIRPAQVPERFSIKIFVVLIIGNSSRIT